MWETIEIGGISRTASLAVRQDCGGFKSANYAEKRRWGGSLQAVMCSFRSFQEHVTWAILGNGMGRIPFTPPRLIKAFN